MENVCLPSGKKLKDLKVVALQKELAKRRLSKVGKKIDLIERLARSLSTDIPEDEENGIVPGDSSSIGNLVEDQSEQKENTLNTNNFLESESEKIEIDEPIQNNAAENSILSTDSVIEITPIALKTPKSRLSTSSKKLAKRSTSKTSASPKTPLTAKKELQVARDITEFLSDDDEFVPQKAVEADKSSEVIPVAASEAVSKAVSNAMPEADSGAISGSLADSIPESVERRGLLKKKMRKLSKTPLLGAIKMCTPASERKKSINKSINTNKTPDRRASKKLTNNSVLGLSSASKAIIKKGSKGPARFTQQHAKEFEKMETISDYQDKVKARHDNLTAGVPDFVKRLATPKSAKIVRSRLVNIKKNSKTVEKQPKSSLTNVDPLKKIDLNSFKFGAVQAKDIKSVQNKKTVKLAEKAKPAQAQEKGGSKADVKQLTKSLTLTIPIQNRRLEFLSTPKSIKSDSKQSRCGYTPRKGTVKFVDTSKLSDEEFAIAVKGGLIPKSSRVVAEYNRAVKTDQLLDIKRKLKIN